MIQMAKRKRIDRSYPYGSHYKLEGHKELVDPEKSAESLVARTAGKEPKNTADRLELDERCGLPTATVIRKKKAYA